MVTLCDQLLMGATFHLFSFPQSVFCPSIVSPPIRFLCLILWSVFWVLSSPVTDSHFFIIILFSVKLIFLILRRIHILKASRFFLSSSSHGPYLCSTQHHAAL